MFIPITKKELKKLGWEKLDIIFITGDAYIDSYYVGVALLGKLLIKHGYRVGIISQPDLSNPEDFLKLGIPELYWGVTGGCVDSMVANYTALKKKRKSDDFTPGGVNNRRPDRAIIRYVNALKQYCKTKKPIVIGGIEASLRRIAHYDYWDDKIRRSILLDSKADYLIYGMAEKTIIEFTKRIKKSEEIKDIKGLCYLDKKPISTYAELPPFEKVSKDNDAFIEMMKIFYENHDPLTAKGLYQKYDNRYLIHNPPQDYPTQNELDSFHELNFENRPHPELEKRGKIKGFETIKNSIIINRGCFGECNFCAITIHQGTRVISRSISSIVKEAKKLKEKQKNSLIINDIGGPTANMFGYECKIKLKHGKCKNKRCLYPKKCENLPVTHEHLIKLMDELRKIDGIKRIFVKSGIRYDLIDADKKFGEKYLETVIKYHTSGQLKIAPEHLNDYILKLMGKPSNKNLKNFVAKFYKINKRLNKKQFLTYYIIVGHPGCNFQRLKNMKQRLLHTTGIVPEQTQIFTPLPLTWSSVMYHTERNPFTGEKIEVIKRLKDKAKLKNYLLKKP